MDERTLYALEFKRILEHLAALCLSSAGKEVALSLRPLSGMEDIVRTQTMLEEARTWLAEGEFKLVSFPDIGGVLAYLNSNAPLLDEDGLWAVKQSLFQAKEAVTSVITGADHRPVLAEFASAAPLPEASLSSLGRCIADDGGLKDESSPGLLLVRNEIRSLHQGCLRRVKDFAEQYNIGPYLQGEYMTLASDRYVLPLKANFKGRFQGIIHDYSRTGETLYFEPMFLVEQNNRLQELKQEEREEERKVLRLLTDLLVQELPQVQNAWQFLVTVDVLLAKCALAAKFDGRGVTLSADTPPTLYGARHPLLVLEALATRHQSAHKVEPLDILFRKGDKVLVISGGNAGGKTVALKTLGLISLMTLAGLPVPVGPGSVLPVWTKIHAFIGDEQSLDDHVSTFTGQIQHLASIWPSLDNSSLVLLDEFGAGTDPSQGAALAQAVLDGLLVKRTYAVTATHFPALKTYALTKEGVRAASVVFDPSTKKPLFHLAYDQVGASQALDVAREHGLPEEVLRQAEQYLLMDGQDSTAIMDRLNDLAAQREHELSRLNEERNRTREKRVQLQEKLEQERTRLQEELREQSRELMQAWKSGQATARQTMKEMARLRSQLRTNPVQEQEKPALSPDNFSIGEKVRHIPWDKMATIKELDAKNKRVKIDLNGVSLWAAFTDLEPTARTPVAKSQLNQPAPGVRLNRSNEGGSLLRADVRGQRAEEALANVAQFLDRSLLAGVEEVEIIHGRGTGALRKSIHEFLRHHPSVEQYHTANEDQGGDGATLVRFK